MEKEIYEKKGSREKQEQWKIEAKESKKQTFEDGERRNFFL
jgi:hypothetical protein